MVCSRTCSRIHQGGRTTKTVKKRPKPIYVVYKGTSQERLFNKALVDRPEGKYVFDKGLPTRIDPLPVVEDSELVLPMVRVGNGDPKGVVWNTDNQSYYRKKARMNPETWVIFERKPSKKDLAVALGEAVADEPEPRKAKATKKPEAKAAPEGG